MDLLITILKGLVTIFYNPFFYVLVAALFLIGWQRVRRERLSFGLKAYGVFNTVVSSVGPSLLLALAGTVLFIGLGVAVPAGVIVLITLCSFFLLLTGQLRFFTGTLSVAIAIWITAIFPELATNFSVLNRWAEEIRGASLTDLGVILAVVLLLEACAILLWGHQQLSPRLINSKRGKKVGAVEANRLWIVPLFLLLPDVGGAIHSGAWWPLSDGQSFGLCALPLGLSIQQFITHDLPKPAIRRSGYWLLMTGVVTAILMAFGYILDISWFALVAAGLAFLSRLALVLKHFYDHTVKPFYFIDQGNGLRVVGVIHHTPAERMGVQIGEIIDKVNGVTVRNEETFYQALQIKPTYCKMEVLDHSGEPRFVKGAIHENDLHHIGLLFLEPSRRVKEKRANSNG